MSSFSLVSRCAGESRSSFSSRVGEALLAARSVPGVVEAPLCDGLGFWAGGRLVAYISFRGL